MSMLEKWKCWRSPSLNWENSGSSGESSSSGEATRDETGTKVEWADGYEPPAQTLFKNHFHGNKVFSVLFLKKEKNLKIKK